jgi:hypothetical protein
MAGLCIVSPLPILAASPPANASRLVTPDPKEALLIPNSAATTSLDYDLGEGATFDSFYLGYHNANPLGGATIRIRTIDGMGGAANTVLATSFMSLARVGLGYPSHFFVKRDVPTTARYIRVQITSNTSGEFFAGVFAVGLAFQPQWGQEWGAGRTLEDTGTAERLFGGGFGIDDGVAATGYRWTFGDLQPDEIRRLYQLVKDRRTTRSVLVVEDPDNTDGLNERIHWGLFQKLDAYERLDPLNTKWALQVGDWA